MAMVNPMLNLANVKDSRWLTLEVCREFQRNKCTRSETECKFAHPPSHVEVQNGRVTACFDSIKGKCQRKDPPCKYLHPPQHLREQLLQNGRNNLIIKNLQLQAAQAAAAGLQPLVPGMIPTVAPPYISTVPTSAVAFNPYLNAAIPTVPVAGTGNEATVVSTQVPGVLPSGIPGSAQQKVTRADRLEVCREFQRCTCTRQPNDCRYAHPPENVTVDPSDNTVTVCMDYMKGKCTRDSCKYFHPPLHLQAQIKAVQQRANAVAVPTRALPQLVEVLTGKKRPREPADDLVTLAGITGAPYAKRVAVADSKSGVPVYQPGNVTYQQALAMQLQQPYLPVTYSSTKLNEIQPYFTYSSTKLNEPYFTCMSRNSNSSLISSPLSPYLQSRGILEPYLKLPMIANTNQPASMASAATSTTSLPTNAASVNYFDENNQLLDTLPLCRDFKSSQCNRPQCKFVHLMEEYVEVMEGKVTVCRDSVKGKCRRHLCKYYHIPVILPALAAPNLTT